MTILLGDLVRYKDRKRIGGGFTGRVIAICADLVLVFWDEADIDQWVPSKELERIIKQ